VTRPEREGFGSKVINRIVKRQLNAEVETDWHEDGIRLTATIPLAGIFPPLAPEAPHDAQGDSVPAQDRIKNRRVMVVDDDWLVAEQHAKAFASMGAAIAGPYLSPVAIPPGDLEGLDLAILALSAEHRDEIVLLADRLRAAGVPTVFLVSKDAPVDLPGRFGEPAVLFKPATVDALIDMGAQRIARRQDEGGKGG
jgi:two-component system CheB/CheR fusion protein